MLRRAAILLIAAGAIVLVSNLTSGGQRAGSMAVAPGSASAGKPTGGLVPPPADLAAPGAVPLVDPGADVSAGSGSDPDGRLALADRLAFWAARVERDPTDHLSTVQLALLEAQAARQDSDLDRYRRADALLERALAVDPTSFPALRAKAGVRFALHDFAGAAALAQRILTVASDDAGALAVHADALLETGDLEAAASGYVDLIKLAPGPAVDARRARLAYLRGDEAEAVRLAMAARDGARDQPGAEDPVFYRYQLAELARLTGDADLARRELKAGLAVAPNDVRLLVCAARIDAATGRVDDAIGRLRQATAIVPASDSLALLGDLLAAAGDDAGAKDAYATVEAIGALAAASGGTIDRQSALLALDHGRADASLVTRLRGALVERPDAYGHDLLAWALHRTGQAAAAAREAEAALGEGIRDARILYHAGIIALADGDVALGRARLLDALARSTALSPAEIADATSHLARLP